VKLKSGGLFFSFFFFSLSLSVSLSLSLFSPVGNLSAQGPLFDYVYFVKYGKERFDILWPVNIKIMSALMQHLLLGR
jgi:hypothetical protein